MGWDPFGGIKHTFHQIGSGITHAAHEVGKGVEHVTQGGLVKDIAHATMDPKTAAQVDASMDTMTKAQNKALEDVGNKIKDSAVHCSRNPGECAANAADFIPFVGTAVRCTQWGVQAAQGHAGGDGPMNCLTNLASDAIPLGMGKAFKLGATGVKAGLNIAKTGAKTSKAGLNLAKTGTKTTKAATASAREEAATAEREAAELLRRQEQAALRIDLRKTAQRTMKDTTTEVVTAGAINAIQESLYDDDYEPSPEEAEFDQKNSVQPAPPSTMAVAVGVVAFAAIVYIAYEKF